MEIYLVRHGETEWNKEGRYYGHTDIGLTEAGKEQAERVGDSLIRLKFDAVYCSPLARAIDTARLITKEPLLLDDRLKEQNFGIFEGKTYHDLQMEYADTLKEWNEDYEHFRIPKGESFFDVRTRIDAFVEELWEKNGRILIVAHKGTFGHMLASMMKLPLSAYWHFVFEQGTYSKIDLEDGFAILRSINQLAKLKD